MSFDLTIGSGVGALIGALHFATLKLGVRAFVEHRVSRAVLVQLSRITFTALALLCVVRALGALGLVAALAGFWTARTFALRREAAHS